MRKVTVADEGNHERNTADRTGGCSKRLMRGSYERLFR
jgi:hypothetical protein